MFDTTTIAVALAAIAIIAIAFRCFAPRFNSAHSAREMTTVEKNWRAWLRELPFGYHEYDKEGMITFVNKKECDLRGIRPQQVLGQHRIALSCEANRDKIGEETHRKLDGAQSLSPWVETYRRPDGEILSLEVHESFLTDQRGAVEGIRGISFDTSEGSRKEREVQQTTSELKAIFQALPDTFVRMDNTGTILDFRVPPSGGAIPAAQECTGKQISSVLPAEVAEQILEAAHKAVKTQALISLEYAVPWVLSQKHFEARISPLQWKEVLVIIREITDRKNAEYRLQQQAEELHAKNEELESALTKAHHATEVKSRFLANMSHEIRTPMNGVLGMVDFLLATKLDSEQQGYAESVKQSAESLLTVINDILDLSKIEAGKLRLELKPFNLVGVIGDAISQFMAPAKAKQLGLAGHIPPYPMHVIGDPGRLRQILVNLIANAVKFTENGHVQVSMETLRRKNDRVTVKVSVTDTGIGIGKNQQSRLFQSFVQADDSMSRKYGGTGLGLAISKQLVEMLGGEIGVESELGKGSKFWFTAVFRQAHAAELVEQPVQVEKPQLPRPAQNGKAELPLPFGGEKQCRRTELAPARLLLAEDNPMNQKLTKAMLEKANFQVDIANNGLEAVAAFRRERYDAILMDCQMPELDGYDATREIRQLELPGQHIPIIAVTAHAMTGDREKCIEAGMDDYLTKPTNLPDLRRIVTQWLEWSNEKLAHTPAEVHD